MHSQAECVGGGLCLALDGSTVTLSSTTRICRAITGRSSEATGNPALPRLGDLCSMASPTGIDLAENRHNCEQYAGCTYTMPNSCSPDLALPDIAHASNPSSPPMFLFSVRFH